MPGNSDNNLKINHFATHCFRNLADQDYVVARMCFRSALVLNFHWSALQALEKYFKAIFLYHRIPAKHVSHDLSKALKLLSLLPFNLDLSANCLEFVRHINASGNNRYLERSYFTYGLKLLELDRAVWEIRRFCRVLVPEFTRNPKQQASVLAAELRRIQSATGRDPGSMRLKGGWLEEVMENRQHPARGMLIWQNPYFTLRRRTKVSTPAPFRFENSPLYNFPEIIDEVEKYVRVPTEIAIGCRNMLAAKK